MTITEALTALCTQAIAAFKAATGGDAYWNDPIAFMKYRDPEHAGWNTWGPCGPDTIEDEHTYWEHTHTDFPGVVVRSHAWRVWSVPEHGEANKTFLKVPPRE